MTLSNTTNNGTQMIVAPQTRSPVNQDNMKENMALKRGGQNLNTNIDDISVNAGLNNSALNNNNNSSKGFNNARIVIYRCNDR